MKRLPNKPGAAAKYLMAVFLLGVACSAAAQPKSDYQIVKSFQAKYKSIREAIRQAQTVQQCGEINADIQELKQEYAADTTLLNKALYPDKYDDEIYRVTVDLQVTQSRLGLIETQVAQITDLELQVRTLSGKVDSLSRENDRLMASLNVMSSALKRNNAVVDSLNKIIARLRQGLRARDAAIFAMVDSMFMQYGTNIQTLPEQQKTLLTRKMSRHNVVEEIHQAAEQNIKFLGTTQLSGKDLVQMIREQRKFSSYWKGLGPRLSRLYVSQRDRERQIVAIDTAVARWGMKADSSLWAGLYSEFSTNNVPVDSFSNADQFVSSLSNYFDTQGGDLKASATEKASRLRYLLKKVWDPSINTQWLPMLVEEGILTKAQVTQLQDKLAAWEGATKPSYVLLYAVVILIFIAVAAFFMWRRKKSPPEAPAQN